MYASDITRTLPASGTFTSRQREIYNIVLGAQQAAIAAFNPANPRYSGTPRIHFIKSLLTTLIRTVKTCTATRSASILFTD
jgi:Metallopeptidase family M24